MRLPLVFFLPLVLSPLACLEPRPDASRYYTLSSGTAQADGAPAADLSLGLGPVAFPAYLDRREFATRVGPEELAYSASDRWAAPLKDLFVRALSEDLRTAVPTTRVVYWPWNRASNPDLAVAIDVLRFEAEPKAAVLEARFAIRSGAGGPPLTSGQTNFREEVSLHDIPATAAALSRGLAALARDIARAAAPLRTK